MPDARSLPLAHGFGLHYDLPVPLYLYLYLLAGGAVVALTFAILGVFLRGTKGPATRGWSCPACRASGSSPSR